MHSVLAAKLARAVILISGRGSNMQMLLKAAEAGSCAINPVAIISNKANALGLKFAQANGVATAVIKHQDFASREAFDQQLGATIASYKPDIIILAGFMRILSREFTERFAGKIINIHPSLLPKYKGLDTHARALAAGDQIHGASVHFVNSELDAGQVILQGVVEIKAGDDADSLAARVLQTEHQILPLAVDWLARGLLEYRQAEPLLCAAPLTEPVIYRGGKLQGEYECIAQLQPR